MHFDLTRRLAAEALGTPALVDAARGCRIMVADRATACPVGRQDGRALRRGAEEASRDLSC